MAKKENFCKKYHRTLDLPVGAILNCAGNSGTKSLSIVKSYGFGARLNGLPDVGVGNMVAASVQTCKAELRKKNHPIAVMSVAVVQQRKAWQQPDGDFLYFEVHRHAGVIVNKGNMKGSLIIGPVASECGNDLCENWLSLGSHAG
ncbi:ribosomal protein L17 [Pisolithus marmoratus]|nr:ribosomal protein L17 [Pisolithus marmoratus]